jgi:hypothetical protein
MNLTFKTGEMSAKFNTQQMQKLKNILGKKNRRHIQGELHRQQANQASPQANNFLNQLFRGHYSPLQTRSLIHKLLTSNNADQEFHASLSEPERRDNKFHSTDEVTK